MRPNWLRKGFGTYDPLKSMKISIKWGSEYQIQLYVAFMDFQKAFNGVEHWAIESALKNSRIDHI